MQLVGADQPVGFHLAAAAAVLAVIKHLQQLRVLLLRL
jgi:hypothetical protein